MEMRSLVTVRGLVWNPQYSRPEFPPCLTPSVVKGFVMFGGFEHVKAFALVFPGSPGMPGVRQCRCSVGNGASADDCGEDSGGAEAAWVFQPLLGCEAREGMAGDRQVERGISLPQRAAGWDPFGSHP